MGLADRYDKVDGGNLGGPSIVKDPGFENDLMANRGGGLIKAHYQHYIDFARGLRPTSKKWISRVQVGVNSKGRVLTPFENGGVHKDHPFLRQGTRSRGM
jgi:hypothetical protein